METTAASSKYGNILTVRETGMDGVTVKYSLFESLLQIDGRYVYSVQLETCSESGRDCRTAYDISRNRSDALNLFHKLADGAVTSCTLYDVLEDLL